jgi:hypothetical protein
VNLRDALRIAAGGGKLPMPGPVNESDGYVLLTICALCATLLLLAAFLLLVVTA